jgi:GNAT superfamily N-acetyltransferase
VRALTAEVVEPAPLFRIVPATPQDVPAVLAMIEALADYEQLRPLCVATEGDLRAALFGSRPAAEVLVGWEAQTAVAFALFFHNFSTFLGRKGLYLEDLFVRPPYRRRGYGRALLMHLARIAMDRGCGRFEWAVLDWNAPAIAFYQSLGAVLLPDWRIVRLTGPALSGLATAPPEGS